MVKFTFEMNDEMAKLIKKLAKAQGATSKAEVFRRAIALLKVAQEAKDQGKTLCVADKGKVEKQLVMP